MISRQFLLLTILLVSLSAISQKELTKDEEWKIYNNNQKKIDSIHKFFGKTFKQTLITKLDTASGTVDTVLNFSLHNKNLPDRDKLYSELVINKSGKYSQVYREKDFEETLRGRTTVFNMENSDLYIRFAVVLYQKGITQTKFHSCENGVLILKELGAETYHHYSSK